jgi:hypothetical protein
MYETGHFASLWAKMAGAGPADRGAGLPGDDAAVPHAPNWRRGVQADLIEQRLRPTRARSIKAVCVVHNETSTGVTSRHRRRAPRDRRRRPPGAADGRHHLAAWPAPTTGTTSGAWT